MFRDDANLGANPALWESIASALDDSEWLVVLLSPDAARSEWVDREVAHWVASDDCYLGNVLGTDRQSTYCSGCDRRLVERRGYVIGENLLNETGGVCPHCETRAAGVWM